MGLTYRRKKAGGTIYMRGFVQVADKRVEVKERSTGSTDRAGAKAAGEKFEADTKAELLHGVAFVNRQMTFRKAASAYVEHGDLHSAEESRVVSLLQFFGETPLGKIDATTFRAFTRSPGQADNSPNTHHRHRNTLAAIFKSAEVVVPEIPGYAIDVKLKDRWLTHERADKLLACYNEQVRPMALVACDCGLRARETVVLTVGDCNPMGDGGFFTVGGTISKLNKNGESRTVPWTARVREALLPLIEGRPAHERLFLQRNGEPYSDPKGKGGNPLRTAHATALMHAGLLPKRVGIRDPKTGKMKYPPLGVMPFRWHDWRHHFATWALVEKEHGGRGWSERRLMQRGGWKDAESVGKYVDLIDFDASGKIVGKQEAAEVKSIAA